MSRFFSSKYSSLEPYVPGEQLSDSEYIKLNTNENPYPVTADISDDVLAEIERLHLYSDPENKALHKKIAGTFGVNENEVLATNGSDEILNFAFMTFCDAGHPAVFADITYGFYPVFARVNLVPFRTVPVNTGFGINPEDYYNAGGTVFIANPNAPTSLALTRDEIEGIIINNPGNIVVIDEAYVDFGAQSCVPLIKKYDNLLITRTFSKSRSMAGARLGFGIACESLIKDLNTVKYSLNPYNVNRMTAAAGIAVLGHEDITKKNIEKIISTRENTKKELKQYGYEFPDSLTNFIFMKHPGIDGFEFYRKMKENKVLIRHFSVPAIKDYNRVTIGTDEQMKQFTALARAAAEGKL